MSSAGVASTRCVRARRGSRSPRTPVLLPLRSADFAFAKEWSRLATSKRDAEARVRSGGGRDQEGVGGERFLFGRDAHFGETYFWPFFALMGSWYRALSFFGGVAEFPVQLRFYWSRLRSLGLVRFHHWKLQFCGEFIDAAFGV